MNIDIIFYRPVVYVYGYLRIRYNIAGPAGLPIGTEGIRDPKDPGSIRSPRDFRKSQVVTRKLQIS